MPDSGVPEPPTDPANEWLRQLMARLMGLSHADIAKDLGKSEASVRTMLCRALAELAEHL